MHDEIKMMEIALFLNDIKKYHGKKVCDYKQNIGTSEKKRITMGKQVIM